MHCKILYGKYIKFHVHTAMSQIKQIYNNALILNDISILFTSVVTKQLKGQLVA